jgi:ABC-type multidrug transport system ATPase subunit
VSHNLPEIARICNRVIVIEHGKKIYDGPTLEGIQLYSHNCVTEKRSFVQEAEQLRFKQISLSNTSISWKATLGFSFEFDSRKCFENCTMRIIIYDESDMGVAEWKSINYHKHYTVHIGHNIISEKLENLNLRNGKYFLTFVLSNDNGIDYLILAHSYASIVVENGVYGNTVCQL